MRLYVNRLIECSDDIADEDTHKHAQCAATMVVPSGQHALAGNENKRMQCAISAIYRVITRVNSDKYS